MTCKLSIVESASAASMRISVLVEQKNDFSWHEGYVGLFAMRCRAMWYVSGHLQLCGASLVGRADLCPSLCIPGAACASHAPLPCVACARCPQQKQSDPRDGHSGGIQAIHTGALVAHALCVSHSSLWCTVLENNFSIVTYVLLSSYCLPCSLPRDVFYSHT